jgi:DEP domain-containing protein 5
MSRSREGSTDIFDKTEFSGKQQRICSLMVHSNDHCIDDIIVNIPGIEPRDFAKIYDPEQPKKVLVLRVPEVAAPQKTVAARLEISILKTVADQMNFVPYGRVVVERVPDPKTVEVDFVELTFRRQFLQRGNMWRAKMATFGRPVHIGQTVVVDGLQATVQEIGKDGKPWFSGIISENTNFVFRSRSSRIIWLVQMSSEMWEYGERLYLLCKLNMKISSLF